LPKLKGFVSNAETSNLDKLVTKAARIFGLRKLSIQYRELTYKDQQNDKWRVEFYILPGPLLGPEKYKLKYFKFNESGFGVEVDTASREDNINKETLLRFAQAENIQSDERWEKYLVPGVPEFSYKKKDFKVFELTVKSEKPSFKLLCKLEENFPFCQCLM
jgi:hypothetical protein